MTGGGHEWWGKAADEEGMVTSAWMVREGTWAWETEMNQELRAEHFRQKEQQVQRHRDRNEFAANSVTVAGKEQISIFQVNLI